MNTYPRTHLKAALALATVLAVVITALPAQQQRNLPSTPISLNVSEADINNEASPAVPELQTENPPKPDKWVHVKIETGDNLAKIFQKMDLPAIDLQNIIDLGKEVKSLQKILPGQELSFQITAEGKLQAIKYKKDVLDTLVITRDDGQFSAQWQSAVPELIIGFEATSISKDAPSLYHAGKAAGLSDSIIMKLSYIFQWDISFALDLRAGDSFSLMYEELFVKGEKVKDREIIAASFTNMGKTYNAIRYTDIAGQTGYYTPDGHSMRKAFLRDPVHFSHVSSSFNLRRLHPIHNKVMPHRGIDYAAAKGTPVLAAGDGKISIRRKNNASGNFVVIQHGEQYTTKYLHLSAFAKNVNPGQNVVQGQTIGYVGATGWATAPHLHYEFLVNGVHRNPKTVSLPKAAPIPRDELARFQTTIQPVLVQMETISGKGLASRKSVLNPSGG